MMWNILLCYSFDHQIVSQIPRIRVITIKTVVLYTYIIRKTETKEEISVSVSALQGSEAKQREIEDNGG